VGATKGPRTLGFADGKGFESNRTPNWAKTYSRQAGTDLRIGAPAHCVLKAPPDSVPGTTKAELVPCENQSVPRRERILSHPEQLARWEKIIAGK
jgi:hypothetical protein